MRNDETNYGQDDAETLPQGERRIAEMLGDLRRVDAPGDFEFHVRSRIAKGRPAAISRGGWLPQMKIIAPTALVLVVAGFFGFSYLRFASSGDNVGVASAPNSSQPNAAPVLKPSLPEALAAQNSDQNAPSRDIIVAPASPKPRLTDGGSTIVAGSGPKQRHASGGSRDEKGGGSQVVTLRGSKTINPPGIDPNPIMPNANVATVSNAAKNSVSDVLSFLGIEAERTAAGWLVKSAKAESTAQRSGIKAGDLIEAIEDHELGSSPVIPNNVTFKSLKIVREGKSLVIALQNR